MMIDLTRRALVGGTSFIVLALLCGVWGCNNGGLEEENLTADDPAGRQESPPENVTPAEPIPLDVQGLGEVTQECQGPIITLSAIPEEGWLFTGWGEIPSRENPVSIMASEFSSMQPRFAPDTDGDGVEDDLDACPATVPGAGVYANGCSDAQTDADGDGVPDRMDTCAESPNGSAVDGAGCAASQRDADGDGVSDADDSCPDTPTAEQVNRRGCGASQWDTDRDGVTDDSDECPDTPADSIVDAVGCAAVQRDSDKDGVPDNDDLCPGSAAGANVTPNGCAIICGNGYIELGEQCDPPNGSTCAADCQLIFDVDSPPNDDCADAIAMGEGVETFSNLAATNDGPYETGECADLGIGADVWYCYTPSCTDTVTVSLCGSTFDTTLIVYGGCEYPASNALACDDDYCGTASGSQVSFAAIAGHAYLIRAGGYASAMGDGVLTVSCGPPPDITGVCGAGAGDCLSSNGSPGCEDVDCCATICGLAPSCCTDEWTGDCASWAEVMCVEVDTSSCGAGAGDCSIANGTAGCEDPDCCALVCAITPECCADSWDQDCAELAEQVCSLVALGACGGESGDCFVANGSAGCADVDCCETVCVLQPACCNDEWNEDCAALASSICLDSGDEWGCGPGAGDCTIANGSPGCEDPSCCALVCGFAEGEYCCTEEWDEDCALAAEFLCVGVDTSSCGPGAGTCTAPNGSPGCEEVDCCALVCAMPGMAYCCTDEWDFMCAMTAMFMCTVDVDTSSCGTDSGDCFAPNGSPGCEDELCCEEICTFSPNCCEDQWDEQCAFLADATCEGGSGEIESCGTDSGDCYAANGSPGCDDEICCYMVCLFAPDCCLTEWDAQCAEMADGVCYGGAGGFESCGLQESGDCFVSNGNPGCDDETCCVEVCTLDSFCCNFEWDEICAEEAAELCER